MMNGVARRVEPAVSGPVRAERQARVCPAVSIALGRHLALRLTLGSSVNHVREHTFMSALAGISSRPRRYAPQVRPELAAENVGLHDSDESPMLAGQDSLAPPFRPVQFLGAKTRTLDSLCAAMLEHLEPGSSMLDVFTGSSIVAQQMARVGFSVAATDALEHCVHFARALLGVGRPSGVREESPPALCGDDAWLDAWGPWLQRERSAINSRDSDALIRISEAIPQIWRPTNAAASLASFFEAMRAGETSPGIVSSHYAGTYFGLLQATEIDRIRAGIAQEARRGSIGPWEESLLLTALLSAASECAFSAGKHYAQPHRIRPDKDLSFIRTRILSDRSKEVGRIFHERLHRAIHAANLAGSGHAASPATLAHHLDNPFSLGKFEGIYADPPYTAQQYSRFYHVPEVICANRVPRLQKVNGHVTRGIYCEGRFKSPFCSSRRARAAFEDLAQLAKAHGATLFLSYSGSRSGRTGNARALNLNDLRAFLVGSFGARHVQERDLPIGYRQFNNTGSSVNGRDDFELLFVARSDA